ncbi:MAG: phenylalanine--tRNA ligase subunit alpha [Mangrovibacterium sp.]
MLDTIKQLKEELESVKISAKEEVEALRIKYTSKKGLLNQLFNDFKNVPAEHKKAVGQAINELKEFALNKINDLKEHFEQSEQKSSVTDLTMPAEPMQVGTRHPLSIIKTEIIDIFSHLGFTVAEGPEIEDDWHVFSALNFPQEHPARDMQDTFFIQRNPDVLLRTHTSSVQVRVMEKTQPPIRSIFPGRVFRNEAVSARAHCIFHQIEGLYVDENVSFADLKQTLLYFSRELFGENTQIRLRPSYFPFTEPSAEFDVSCTICGGKGCNVCKHTGWLEILGCGMVDPAVLELCGIDSKKYTGFAFGMGIERIAMLKYGITDIRHFFEGDVRFLRQFISAY